MNKIHIPTPEQLEQQSAEHQKYGSYKPLFWTTRPHRNQIVPGLSIGLATPVRATGSLGVVLDYRGFPIGTSNAHVLPDNDWSEIICNPGTADWGLFTNEDRERLMLGLWVDSTLKGDLDFAFFNMDADIDPRRIVNRIGRFQSPVAAEPLHPEPGMEVIKVGRTTGIVRGIVTERTDVELGYPTNLGGNQVKHLWEVKPKATRSNPNPEYSLAGDSGAAVWTKKDGRLHWVGTHCGGNRERAFLSQEEQIEEERGYMADATECFQWSGASKVWGGV